MIKDTTTTVLGAALAKAGLPKHQMRAFSTAAEFIDAGGTRSEWLQVYDLVAGKIEERAPVKPKAVEPKAEKQAGRPPLPSDLRAEARAFERAAVSVFDQYRTHSGRMWGNVGYDELDSLRDDGEFAISLKAHVGQLDRADRSKKIRDLVSARDFVQLARKAGIKPS